MACSARDPGPETPAPFCTKVRWFTDIHYAAGSWNRRRRVIAKVLDIELQANDGHDVRAHFQVPMGLLMVSASDKRHYYFVGASRQ